MMAMIITFKGREAAFLSICITCIINDLAADIRTLAGEGKLCFIAGAGGLADAIIVRAAVCRLTKHLHLPAKQDENDNQDDQYQDRDNNDI